MDIMDKEIKFWLLNYCVNGVLLKRSIEDTLSVAVERTVANNDVIEYGESKGIDLHAVVAEHAEALKEQSEGDIVKLTALVDEWLTDEGAIDTAAIRLQLSSRPLELLFSPLTPDEQDEFRQKFTTSN